MLRFFNPLLEDNFFVLLEDSVLLFQDGFVTKVGYHHALIVVSVRSKVHIITPLSVS